MANRMNPPAEGQEKDVLLVLDKLQGKVSAVKGIDNEGNLQTVEPTQSHSGGVYAGGQEQRCVQQLHFQFFPQVSGHGGTGFVPQQGYGSGTGRKSYRGQPPQPHAGGRQTGGNVASSESRQ